MNQATSRIDSIRDAEPFRPRVTQSDDPDREIARLRLRLAERSSELEETRSQLARSREYADCLDVQLQQLAEELKLEKRSHRSRKLASLSVLAGGVAHEFNNLLMSILGHTDLVGNAIAPQHDAQRSIERIGHAARRAADLAGQMLAFSGRGNFVITPLDLSDLLQDMLPTLEGFIPAGASFETLLDFDLPAIDADSSQLRQLVENLVKNAAESLADGEGSITVSTRFLQLDARDLKNVTLPEIPLAAGPFIALEVADNGCGIEEKVAHLIFEPFFSTKFTGRGLGLAAVSGIVRGHGGAVRVHSAPSRGTTIQVLLPATQPNSGDAILSDATDNRRTVLVVDDEETVLRVARDMLEMLGYRVLTAGDGEEGLEVFERHASEIALVMLDKAMPKMGGEQTLRKIREMAPSTRVVLATGYSEDEARSRFAGLDLDGYLQKPFRLHALRTELETLLTQDG